MKFKTKLLTKHSAVWGQHIMVPDKFSTIIKKRKNQRLICLVNGLKSFNGALMPNGNNEYYLTLNKEFSRSLKLDEGDLLQIELQEDKSKYGMPMPPEMQEILDHDPEADAAFHKLSPGKQRSLLYIIGKPKTSDTRITKAIVITEYLKATGGKLDFKELNEAFKQAKEF